QILEEAVGILGDAQHPLFQRLSLDGVVAALRARALGRGDDLLVRQYRTEVRARSAATTPADTADAELKEMALANERVRHYTEGRDIRKVVTVPNKLVNVVVG
ncbi:MAG: hypothetical protein R6W94_05995, partial [Spirochaetia bacterium]